MARIAVLGSNSFAGTWFISKALSSGDMVLAFSRSPEVPKCRSAYKFINHDLQNMEFIQADLNNDLSLITHEIEKFKADFVVDFASQGMVAESWVSPEDWYQTTIVAKVKLHQALRKLSSLRRYIRVSTPEVYGSCEGEVEESMNYFPSTPYAVSHAAIDMSLNCFFNNYKFPVVYTRSANFYGPGQQLYRIIPRSIIYMKMGRKIPLHGGGESVRSFIHGKDVSEATYQLMLEGVPGEIYHLSTDEPIAIKDLVKLIANKMDLDFADVVNVTQDRPGKDKVYSLSTAKIKKFLGWSPSVNLSNGIDEVIRWVDEYWDDIKDMRLDYQHIK